MGRPTPEFLQDNKQVITSYLPRLLLYHSQLHMSHTTQYLSFWVTGQFIGEDGVLRL